MLTRPLADVDFSWMLMLRHHKTRPLFVLLLVCILGSCCFFLIGPRESKVTYAQTKTVNEQDHKRLPTPRTLNEAAVYFDFKSRDIHGAPECFPIHINKEQGIHILYPYCSQQARHRDAQPVKINSEFDVPEELARTYNFWRRIYSLWGDDQYVLHSAAYPELVLEIADASHLRDLNWQQRGRVAKRVLNSHRREYRMMLQRMHANRFNTAKFSPAMRRIAAALTHVTDRDKYKLASLSLRVQRGQRDQFAKGLSVSTRYMPMIKKIFAAEGIPVSLAQIAYLESSFNVNAYSKVGAAGVYQIMPATGRPFMHINDNIDERRDPIKSARVAANLLKSNYKRVGHWPLAIIGYNHGINGIRRAVRKVGSSDIVDLIQRYRGPAFGFASKSFYPSFLAVLATTEEADIIFPKITKYPPLRFVEIKLDRPTRLRQIKKQFNVTNEILRVYNPDLSKRFVLRNGTLPKRYILKLPMLSNDSVLTQASNP